MLKTPRTGTTCLIAIAVSAGISLLSCAGSLRAPKSAEETVIDGLGSGREPQVKWALQHIQANKPKILVPALKDLALNSSDPAVRDLALGALKFYNKRDIFPVWTEVLARTGSLVTKSDIIDYLSDMDDKRLLPPLTRELASPYYLVRKKSALLLKKLGDDRMYPSIFTMAESQDPVSRIHALEALHFLHDKRFNSVVMELLKDGNKSVRIYAVSCVQKNEITDALPVLREMASGDAYTDARIAAVNALSLFRDGASVNIFLKNLGHADAGLRGSSVEALNRLNMKYTAVQISSHLLTEGDDEIKWDIMELLIRFRSAGDIGGLKKILSADKNPKLRVRSAYALGIARDDRAIPVLRDALKDDDYRVRAEAASSLGMYDARTVSQLLIDIISSDRSRYVRSSALYALKRLANKKTLLPLFNIYSAEKDPVFSDMLRKVIIEFINKFV